MSIDITGGELSVLASDDGMNAAGGNDGSGFDGPGGGEISLRLRKAPIFTFPEVSSMSMRREMALIPMGILRFPVEKLMFPVLLMMETEHWITVAVQ